jgi:hypothetical protein
MHSLLHIQPDANNGAATMTGAQYEIRIDGVPRSYRDRKDYAMEAARLIKQKSAQHGRGQRLAKRRRDRGGR